MRVLSLITLPQSIPMQLMTGQAGHQAVLEELNATWRNAGSGVIFGSDDPFESRFQAFSDMLGKKIETVKNTVLKAVETICCPNKFQEIGCEEDLHHVPACMFIPILTDPFIRPIFESGRLDGWGVTAEKLPDEDVYGRLINNGRIDTGAEDYTRDKMMTWVVYNDDPDVTREDLDLVEYARGFCSSFLKKQMSDDGEELDFTNLPNRMSKLMDIPA